MIDRNEPRRLLGDGTPLRDDSALPGDSRVPGDSILPDESALPSHADPGAAPQAVQPRRDADLARGTALLADAEADRAVGRAAAALAGGSLTLGVLALLFVVLARAEGPAGWLPQVVVLGVGQVVGLAAAVRCSVLLRSLRKSSDTGLAGVGRRAADSAAHALAVMVRVVPAVTVPAVVVGAVTLRPVSTAMLSGAVGLAVVAQLLLLAVVQQRALRRVARTSPGRPLGRSAA